MIRCRQAEVQLDRESERQIDTQREIDRKFKSDGGWRECLSKLTVVFFSSSAEDLSSLALTSAIDT